MFLFYLEWAPQDSTHPGFPQGKRLCTLPRDTRSERNRGDGRGGRSEGGVETRGKGVVKEDKRKRSGERAGRDSWVGGVLEGGIRSRLQPDPGSCRGLGWTVSPSTSRPKGQLPGVITPRDGDCPPQTRTVVLYPVGVIDGGSKSETTRT